MSDSIPVFRTDKFVVPGAARGAFLEAVGNTHAVLRRQSGFVRDVVLEKISGPAQFNFVTVVEWESEAAMDAAAPAVRARHQALGFDREAFMREHGIRPDIGHYRAVEV